MPNETTKHLLAGLLLVLPVSGETAGKIRVCVNSNSNTSTIVLIRAKAISSRMFATARVNVEWSSIGAERYPESRQSQSVILDFVTNAPLSQHPGAFAYAQVYDAVHIVVLLDRIESSADSPIQLSTLLAHVMTHEITHLLQGISRHSETGVMKAHWSAKDILQMVHEPLRFAPEDIDLIQRGLVHRRATAL